MAHELEVIADAIGAMMAKASGDDPPKVKLAEGSSLVGDLTLAGQVAHFYVDTPFGFPVSVVVCKAGGMFNVKV